MNHEPQADAASTPSPPTKKKSPKRFLKLLLLIPLAAVVIVALIMLRFKLDGNIDYDVSTQGVEVPVFSEVEIDFTHVYKPENSIQLVGGAAFDLDHAGGEELFLGGGEGQGDRIFRLVDGAFVDITEATGYEKATDEATLSVVSLDVDGNGFDDLIVTTSTAIWLHRNSSGTFTGEKLDVPVPSDTSPLSVAVADINGDGHFDMYMCGYIRKELVEGLNIFNQENYGGSSLLLINNGDDTFTDGTAAAGLTYKHNTFQGVFSDIDSDGAIDLVVAHDTGQVRTWRNRGDGTFENTPNPNSQVYSYPMGIAVSDYDNSGTPDFFFSNTGTTAPAFIAKGDLRDDQTYYPKWMMFRNDGGFAFTDVAEEVKLADYEFSWGPVFEDFNLDGRPDLAVAENFVGLPPYKLPFLRLPCRFLIQNTQGEFAEVGAQSGVVNKRFSISPVTADFNGDGAPDLVHVNLAGKSLAFLSAAPTAGFVKVKLPNTVASVGASLKATLSDGRTLSRVFVKGEGLCSDSTPIITLGTADAQVADLEVTFLGHAPRALGAVALGTTVVVDAPETR